MSGDHNMYVSTNRPFDLEKAIAGEPIYCRDGHEAKFVAYEPEARAHSQVVVLINKGIYSFNTDGRLWNYELSPMDLFMVPKKTKVWVNFYAYGQAEYYLSENGAEQCKKPERFGGKAYLVEVEE